MLLLAACLSLPPSLGLPLSLGLPSAHAAGLPRIASINACTDQLLMALADPEQILGLSPHARDPARSWDAAKARQYPQLSGAAEDVLVLAPDIVVAGRFTRLATRQLLKDKGLRVVEFDVARSLDDVKKSIRQMGDVTQHPDRAAAEISRLDAAIVHARDVASRKPRRVLAVSRRGWVSGRDSLTSSLLANAGLTNAAGDLGIKSGGFASLESIIGPQAGLHSGFGRQRCCGRRRQRLPAASGIGAVLSGLETHRDSGTAHGLRRTDAGGSAGAAGIRTRARGSLRC
jgi:ABC-type hemin transport system substrate-binding protein